MKSILSFLLLSFILVSCNDDDSNDDRFVVDPTYRVSAVVLNEGLFKSGTADLSLIYDDGNVVWNAYNRVNSPHTLGDVGQDIEYINGYYFVVVNNSQKIEVINPKTFQSVATIVYDKAGSPRQIEAISDTTAVVSDLKGQVVIVRTKSPFDIIKYVKLPQGASFGIEKMAVCGGKIFGAYLYRGDYEDEGIAVFDVDNVATDAMRLVNGVTVDESTKTAKMLVDKNGFVWVLVKGNNSAVWKIIDSKTEKVVDELEIPFLRKGDENLELSSIIGMPAYNRSDISKDKSKIYFVVNTCTDLEDMDYHYSVLEIDVDSHEYKIHMGLKGMPKTLYGMSVAPNGDVYVSDYIKYTAQRGFIRRYTTSGEVFSYRVGVYPRAVLFPENYDIY